MTNCHNCVSCAGEAVEVEHRRRACSRTFFIGTLLHLLLLRRQLWQVRFTELQARDERQNSQNVKCMLVRALTGVRMPCTG